MNRMKWTELNWKCECGVVWCGVVMWWCAESMRTAVNCPNEASAFAYVDLALAPNFDGKQYSAVHCLSFAASVWIHLCFVLCFLFFLSCFLSLFLCFDLFLSILFLFSSLLFYCIVLCCFVLFVVVLCTHFRDGCGWVVRYNRRTFECYRLVALPTATRFCFIPQSYSGSGRR